MKIRLAVVVCLVSICLSGSLLAQGLGNYAFGPFDSYGFDTINRGNLNTIFSIPVFSKPGRGGTNFSYALTYNGLIWSPTSVSGDSVWTPAPNWGWADSTNAQYGYVTYDLEIDDCTLPPKGLQNIYTVRTNFVYHDNHGGTHGIPYSFQTACGASGTPTGTGTYTLKDNSGLTVYRTNSTFVVFSSSGSQSLVPVYINFSGHPSSITPGAATYTDTNGNEITASSSGTFTDTMGLKALTVSGSEPNPEVYTYTDPSGTSRTVTVNYGSYSVQTAFGVTGVAEYSGTSIPLISSIVYSADNSSYSFTYEPTPGNPAAVTGRIAQITLRTGGTISYSYTGGNNGIESDGTTSGLTRATTDGSTKYTRSNITSTQSSTQKLDGLQNATTSAFLINGGFFYETDNAVYTGAASGTPLVETQTCYNNNTVPPCTATSITVPFTDTNSNILHNGAVFAFDDKNYTGPELVLSEANSATSSSYTYNTYTGLYGISFYRVASVTVGSNAAKYTFGYDEATPSPTSGLPNHVAVTTSRGNLTSSHIWLNNKSYTLNQTSKYDDTGQVLSQSDWNGNTTTFQYDTATDTLPIKVTAPATGSGNLFTSSTYDTNTGLPVSTFDANNNQTIYTYTGLEQPSTIQYPDGGLLTYGYPSPTVTTLTTLQQGSTDKLSTTTLDGYGRNYSVDQKDTSSGDELVNYAYDVDGRLYSVTNPHRSSSSPTDGTTYYAYDAAGRQTVVTEPDNSTVQYAYNAATVTITDEAQNKRQLSYDYLGRTTQALEQDSSGNLTLITNYTYNAINNLTSIVQQGGATSSSLYRTRTFTYDSAGRMLTSLTPEQGTTTFQYDNGSNILCSGSPSNPCIKTDANGTVTTLLYDTLNRVLGKTYAGSTNGTNTPAVSFSYDQATANGKGQRTGMNDGSGQSSWSYDQMGRVATVQKTINGVSKNQSTKTLTYTYNKDGSVSNILDWSGFKAAYSYNDAGMTTSVIDPTGINFATNAIYAPSGQLTGLVQGVQSGFNGLSTTNQYNSRLQTATMNSSTPAVHVLGLTYGYGTAGSNNGNILSIANVGFQTWAYTYDNLNRLSSAQQGTAWANTYVYDNWNNLLQKNPVTGHSGESLSISVSASNQVAGLTYDAAGEVTKDNIGNQWTYDAEGRVLTAAGYSYVYDGDGNRVMKVGTNARMYWSGADGRALTETDLFGGFLEQNIYLNGQQIARKDSTGNLHYFVHDARGSERIAVSSTGTIEDSLDYFPWGRGSATYSDKSGNLYMFAGDELDTETSTYHTQFRQLSYGLSRWLVPDPYAGSYDVTNPQSLNRYTYVLDNPMRYVDRFGLELGDPGDANCEETYEGCVVSVTADPPDPPDTVGVVGIVSQNGGAPHRCFVHCGQKPPAPSKKGCPAVPTAPPGANVNQNMAKAKIQGIFNPLAPLWFYNQVNYGGAMDYKTQGAQYEDFGNFNYGATGTAAYAPSFTLLRAAGWAQRGHPSSPQFGGNPGSLPGMVLNPFGGTAPYGDDPHDQQMIQQGIQYARMGCGG